MCATDPIAILATAPAQGDLVQTWAFLVMLLLTGGFAIVTITLAEKIGPKKKIKEKYEPYECGIEPQEPVLQRMDIQFYRTSILFLIFGVELVFFYPWAVQVRAMARQGGAGLAIGDMAIFIAILLVGFLFAWTKGALEWRQRPRNPR